MYLMYIVFLCPHQCEVGPYKFVFFLGILGKKKSKLLKGKMDKETEQPIPLLNSLLETVASQNSLIEGRVFTAFEL